MGEFNKDQGQGNQDGQFGNKSAFGQFDNDQNQQDRVDRTEQDSKEFEGADSGKQMSAGRDEETGGKGGQQGQDWSGKQDVGGKGEMSSGQQGGFEGKGGQYEQSQDRGQQQADDQYRGGQDSNR